MSVSSCGSFDAMLPAALTALIQGVVPKKTSRERVQSYARELFADLKSCLLDQEADSILYLDEVPLSANPNDQRKPRIWAHKDPQGKGVCLIYIPDPVEGRVRGDGILELRVTEVFISTLNQSSFKIEKSTALDYKTRDLNQELENRALALNLPFGDLYFAPILMVGAGFAVKGPEYESLQKDQPPIHSLSTLEFLEVLEGVIGGLDLLERNELVSLDITPENIVFKRREDGSYDGKIDHFASLAWTHSRINPPTNKRQNVLAQNGYASPETDRYALVFLIAERVFLNLEEPLELNLSSFEKHALKRIESHISDKHYQEVIRLKNEHEGFQRGFSQSLLNYVERMRREGVENFQCHILDQFAYNMALFTEAAFLFMKTMLADTMHRQLLLKGKSPEEVLASDFKIPTLEEICEALQVGKSELERLSVKKEETNVSLISLDVAEKIIYKVLPGERFHEAHKCIDAFWRIVNECLDHAPHVGREIRVHQEDPWNKKGLIPPVSFWLRIQKDELILEIFDQSVIQPLGYGAYKKVKAGMQVKIFSNGTVQFTPIAIPRFKEGLMTWDEKIAGGNKLLENLLAEPGAENYFVAPLKKHAPHEVNGIRKLEGVAERFEATLDQILKSRVIKIKGETRYLSMLDDLSFLENIGEGIKRIARKDLSHQDIKSSNIALVLREQELIALIFDCDLLAPLGKLLAPHSYYSWNAIRRNYGFVAKETDLYGYVLILSDTLLTGFSAWQDPETSETAVARHQRIARGPEEEKETLKRGIKERILNSFFIDSRRDMETFFSKSSGENDMAFIPDSFFNYIRTMSKEAPIVAFHLKRRITEWLILPPVFDLLVKTLQADLASLVKIENKLRTLDRHTQDLLKQAAQEALNEAEFPTYEEIQKTLDWCKEIAYRVEQRCIKASARCIVS